MLLDKYVSDDGARLPLDWHDHQQGYMHEDACLFCKEPHDLNMVYQYDPERPEQRRDLGVFACNACNTVIQLNLIRHTYPTFFEDKDELIGPKETLEDKELNSTAYRRIVQFNDGYLFDDTVHLRYRHLTLNWDQYANNKVCYFCEHAILEGDPVLVRVPVHNKGSFMSGGKVAACYTCARKLDKDNMAADLMSVGYHIQPAKCGKCNEQYLIHSTESIYRNSVKPRMKEEDYLCPSCAYEQSDKTYSIYHVLYSEHNKRPRTGVMVRYKEIQCNYCLEVFKIDMTINVEKLESHRLHSGGICADCRELYPSYLVDGAFVHHHSEGNLKAIISSTDGEWAYVIVRKLKTGTIAPLVRTPDGITYTKSMEATAMAVDECYRIVNGEQLELFPEKNNEDN